MQRKWRIALAVAVDCVAFVRIETLQIHAGQFFNVLGRCEQHRWLGQILHAIEFGSVRYRMVQFVELLATAGSHFAFGGTTLFVACLAFSPLQLS